MQLRIRKALVARVVGQAIDQLGKKPVVLRQHGAQREPPPVAQLADVNQMGGVMAAEITVDSLLLRFRIHSVELRK